jgi:putative ABC transport system permease protein
MGFHIAVTSLSLTVRTRRDPTLLVEPIREILKNKDANAVFVDPTTMVTIVDDDLAGFRTVMVAVGLLSGLAVLLTSLGLYGVLAYQVSQRSSEFGIRMAVGASTADLIGMVLKQGVNMIAVGLLVGVACALPASRLLRQLLFGIEPLDLRTYAAATAFLVLTGVLASLLPAWRATRVNLVEVLRRD